MTNDDRYRRAWHRLTFAQCAGVVLFVAYFARDGAARHDISDRARRVFLLRLDGGLLNCVGNPARNAVLSTLWEAFYLGLAR
jgi:hypothetical protein